MKLIMILGSLASMSIMAYLATDMVLNSNPEYVYQERFKSDIVGGKYADAERVLHRKAKFVASEGNWNIWSDSVSGKPCYFKIKVQDGIITNFKTAGQCLVD